MGAFEMKIQYYPDTDSLYIKLADLPAWEGREVSPGIVVDYTDTAKVVGIGIDNASEKVDLSRLVLGDTPFGEIVSG